MNLSRNSVRVNIATIPTHLHVLCAIRQSALSPEKQEHISSLPFVVVVVVASICFSDPPAVRFISREADDVRMDWEGI